MKRNSRTGGFLSSAKLLPLIIFSLLVLVLSTARESSAAPVFGEVFQLRQPDGSSVEVRIWGDEFYQVVESLDGYTLVRDPRTLWICYAGLSSDGNELLSTGILANEPLPAQIGIQPNIRINKDSARAKIAAAHARFAAGETETLTAMSAPPMMAPSFGNVKGICLIVDFPDEPNTIPPIDVNNYCNQLGYTGYGNNGSIRDYFYDVSDGALTYTNYVPPVYYTAQNNKGYYDNPSEPAGPKARELIIEALNWLDDRGFDFSQYDSDSDDLIDGINCFYAGTCSSGWAMGLWPHSSGVSFSADGVYSYLYQITPMGSSLTIGTFCHENGHMICWWPDLYDYGYESRGVGTYCLMASGSQSYNPHEPCAYLKDISGWATTTILTTPQTGLSVTAGINSFYKYPHPTLANEYYLISNRQKTGRDSTLTDAGIAVWHIDSNGSNDNEQMTPELHYEVTLVQADGDWDLERNQNSGDSTDLYDAGSYNQCGPLTDPNTKWWAGNASRLNVYNISASGSTMTFDFDLGDELLVMPDEDFLSSGSPGGPFNPDSKTYTLTNAGDSAIGWTAAATQNWLDVTPTGGTLNPSDSIPVEVSLNADANGLSTGNYIDTLTFTNTSTMVQQTRDVSLDVINIIYSAYMDTDPGWTLDSGVGSSKWEWGVPTGGGGAYGNPDPTSGYTDSNVMGYNLSGDYRNNIISTEWATTPAIDCSNYTNVQFKFYRWLNVELPTYDHAYVEVSNNGSSWNRIWDNAEEITDSSWTLQTFDISSIADNQSTVYIRWGMGPTDSSWQFSGWNIDDVEVTGDPNVNQPPVAQNGVVSTQVAVPVTATLLATDDGQPNPPGALTYIITSLPSYTTLSDPGAGLINSVPYTLFGNGNQVQCTPEVAYACPDKFTFVANDGGSPPEGGNSNTASITINVQFSPEVIYETYFNSGLPAGWSIVDGFSDGRTWTSDNPGGQTDPNGNWTGTFMIVDSAWAYVYMDEQLITHSIDCSGYQNVALSFKHYFRYWSGGYDEIGDVDVRINAGLWQNVARYEGATASGLVELDLSSIADDQPDVQIRWHYYNTDWEWYWGIDDVQITASVVPEQIPGDFVPDCNVDFDDFDILANQWLQTPGSPSADIAPEAPDGFVDEMDLAVFVDLWLFGL